MNLKGMLQMHTRPVRFIILDFNFYFYDINLEVNILSIEIEPLVYDSFFPAFKASPGHH